MGDVILNPMAGRGGARRLSDGTRELAWRYLTGQYQSRIRDAGFRVADLGLPDDFPPERRHGKAAILIAEKSSLDILPEERLAGSASNIQGLWHLVPGYAPSGKWGGADASISHTTVDFGDAVRKGLSGLEAEIRRRMDGDNDIHHNDFFSGLLDVIKAMRVWTGRYRDAYRRMLSLPENASHAENLRAVLERLQRVPENPPQTFAEALQSFWSFFEFQRLCGNWSGLGRFDEILGPYLTADLQSGAITLDEARELVAHFWIKGTEWCFGLRSETTRSPGSGDAQNYQNIILGGIDKAGRQIENDVTFLVLDVIEELHISDYPVTVRLNSSTSERLLRRIAEVQLLGGGIVSVYNEPQVLRGLESLEIPSDVARTFTNDGCWEIILPGQTNFGYCPLDFLLPFQDALFVEKTPETYGELYQSFLANAQLVVDKTLKDFESSAFKGKSQPGDYPEGPIERADVVLSLLEPSCRESGCSYTLHGTRWTFRAIHFAGLPDVANSLYAIRKNVFEKGLVSLQQLVGILKDDWHGSEPLRLQFANSLDYYGNDNPEVDEILRNVLHDCSAIIGKTRKAKYITVPVGVSTFGREIAFAPNRLATAFGKHAHEYLAPNLSPTPGTDKSPVTAVLNSYCRMDFMDTPNGCPLDLRLSAGIRQSANAVENLESLLRVFLEKNGLYLQIDTVDPEMLRAAKKEPDRFPNLVVRISGWSARFASLNEEWQDMIINRTALEC